MTAQDLFVAPFADYLFMRKALVSAVALALSAAPLGLFLSLRRMSLMGDALSHAILPGVALGFMAGGLSLAAMGLGGLLAGMLVALLADTLSRHTTLRQDTSLSAIYLLALALGVVLVTAHGSPVDLLHFLFGSALGVDSQGLLLVVGTSSLSLVALALLYRGLVLHSLAPEFARSMGLSPGHWQRALLLLVVCNLVAGFQALGTLMAVGLMMLPAAAARLWHPSLAVQLPVAAAIGAVSSVAGLLVSFHLDTASGPTIVCCAGACYLASVLLGPLGLRSRGPAPGVRASGARA